LFFEKEKDEKMDSTFPSGVHLPFKLSESAVLQVIGWLLFSK